MKITGKTVVARPIQFIIMRGRKREHQMLFTGNFIFFREICPAVFLFKSLCGVCREFGTSLCKLIIACPVDYSMQSVYLSREKRELQLHDMKELDVPENYVLCYLLNFRTETNA
jgi:hypothetical protein